MTHTPEISWKLCNCEADKLLKSAEIKRLKRELHECHNEMACWVEEYAKIYNELTHAQAEHGEAAKLIGVMHAMLELKAREIERPNAQAAMMRVALRHQYLRDEKVKFAAQSGADDHIESCAIYLECMPDFLPAKQYADEVRKTKGKP